MKNISIINKNKKVNHILIGGEGDLKNLIKQGIFQ